MLIGTMVPMGNTLWIRTLACGTINGVCVGVKVMGGGEKHEEAMAAWH